MSSSSLSSSSSRVSGALLQSWLLVTGGGTATDHHHRNLEQDLPPLSFNYTSRPLPVALEATPFAFRDDQVIDAARQADANGNCGVDRKKNLFCHIPFPSPSTSSSDSQNPKIGVILYGGALVDPRSYSPIAALVRDRFGYPVVIPIFYQDLAFAASGSKCDTGRLEIAKSEFPTVQNWILVGHSMGGIAAMSDLWQQRHDPQAAGLVLLSSFVIPNIPGCEGPDFSNFSSIPMASLIGTLDGMINKTMWEENKIYNSPPNATFYVEVLGADHASFGAYDIAGREEALGGRTAEPAAIVPGWIVWDLVATSIAHVASRIQGAPPPIPQQVVEAVRVEEQDSSKNDDDNVAVVVKSRFTREERTAVASILATATNLSWIFQWMVGSPWH